MSTVSSAHAESRPWTAGHAGDPSMPLEAPDVTVTEAVMPWDSARAPPRPLGPARALMAGASLVPGPSPARRRASGVGFGGPPRRGTPGGSG
jgi:hypothetical protein